MSSLIHYIYIYENVQIWKNKKPSENNFIYSLNYLPTLNVLFLNISLDMQILKLNGKMKVSNLIFSLVMFCFKFM